MTKRSRITPTMRSDLRGLDGEQRLRTALDTIKQLTDFKDELVVVDNGSRGPNVLDTRGMKGRWVIEQMLPAGVIAAICDLDDPSPETLLNSGFQVVQLLHIHGEVETGTRVRIETFFHPDLDLEPHEPFDAIATDHGWERA